MTLLVATMMSAFVAFFIASELNTKVAQSDTVIRELEIRTAQILAERDAIEAQLKEQLTSQSANSEQLRSYEETISHLQSQVDQLSTDLRALISENPNNTEVREIDKQVGESRDDIERLSNSIFFVSFFHKGLNPNDISEINNILFAQFGFSAHEVRERLWVSTTSVWYYDDFSKEKAELISNAISELTNINITPRLGSGLGLSADERKIRIVVQINA